MAMITPSASCTKLEPITKTSVKVSGTSNSSNFSGGETVEVNSINAPLKETSPSPSKQISSINTIPPSLASSSNSLDFRELSTTSAMLSSTSTKISQFPSIAVLSGSLPSTDTLLQKTSSRSVTASRGKIFGKNSKIIAKISPTGTTQKVDYVSSVKPIDSMCMNIEERNAIANGKRNSNVQSITTACQDDTRIPGLVGLQNLGNTCFMNSVIQCLSNIPKLTSSFEDIRSCCDVNQKRMNKGTLAHVFDALLAKLWANVENNTSEAPKELKKIIGKNASRFLGYDQQDAQEFLTYLLDGLHDELNNVKTKPPYYEIKDGAGISDKEKSIEYWKYYCDRNDSTIKDLFCGQIRSEITCRTCNHRSTCFDVFWDLSVPIPKSSKSGFDAVCTIQDCLKSYTEKEVLSDDSYYCCKCKMHRSVVKQMSIFQCPSVLVLHIKRFSHTATHREKISVPVKFPLKSLQMSDYCSKDSNIQSDLTYDLLGVSHHIGSLNGGHYIAECFNKSSKRWYNFDDVSVTMCKPPEAASSTAYILFYTCRNVSSNLYEKQQAP